ncbi:hypothetical protein, partial [Mucilaginibacter flavus]|uniref:hypothetical protein n=1 Tax=Mucilaginibacter flavus TaxID=931504 RepID=UPI0025B4D125
IRSHPFSLYNANLFAYIMTTNIGGADGRSLVGVSRMRYAFSTLLKKTSLKFNSAKSNYNAIKCRDVVV